MDDAERLRLVQVVKNLDKYTNLHIYPSGNDAALYVAPPILRKAMVCFMFNVLLEPGFGQISLSAEIVREKKVLIRVKGGAFFQEYVDQSELSLIRKLQTDIIAVALRRA